MWYISYLRCSNLDTVSADTRNANADKLTNQSLRHWRWELPSNWKRSTPSEQQDILWESISCSFIRDHLTGNNRLVWSFELQVIGVKCTMHVEWLPTRGLEDLQNKGRCLQPSGLCTTPLPCTLNVSIEGSSSIWHHRFQSLRHFPEFPVKQHYSRNKCHY